MQTRIDQIGIGGILITALLSPCCFPLFGIGLTALGFGTFELFGGWTMYVFQALAVISLVGFAFSYSQHKSLYPLLTAIPSAALIFLGFYIIESESWLTFIYAGLFGLTSAGGINFYQNRVYSSNKLACCMPEIIEADLKSVLTCPACKHSKEEIMPTDACQYFYECENCKVLLKPKSGDCCVYCSYGSNPCPPKQSDMNCCK